MGFGMEDKEAAYWAARDALLERAPAPYRVAHQDQDSIVIVDGHGDFLVQFSLSSGGLPHDSTMIARTRAIADLLIRWSSGAPSNLP